MDVDCDVSVDVIEDTKCLVQMMMGGASDDVQAYFNATAYDPDDSMSRLDKTRKVELSAMLRRVDKDVVDRCWWFDV